MQFIRWLPLKLRHKGAVKWSKTPPPKLITGVSFTEFMAGLRVLACSADEAMLFQSQATQSTAMSTADKEAQCGTGRLCGVRERTQTDPTTVCSASCQTDAAFPDVGPEAGVSCKRFRKSFNQRSSAIKRSDRQNTAELPVSAVRNSFQAHVETPPEKKLDHACCFCSQCYADEASLAIHESEHTEQETKSLSVSQKCLSRKEQLVAHWEMPHSCQIHEKCCSQKGQVEHATMHTREKPFSCRFCHERHTSKYSLSVHEKTHGGDPKPCVCNVCQMCFSGTQPLVAHWSLHAEEALPHSCTVCEKRFSCKRGLVEHARVHTIEKYHRCRFCDEHLKKGRSPDVHERTHTGEVNPFVCSICHKRFSARQHLVDHVQAHTDERPFECNLCPARFSYKSALNSHIKAHATGKVKSYSCAECQEAFAQRSDFSTHLKQHSVPAKMCWSRHDYENLFPNKEGLSDDEKNLEGSVEGDSYACLICHKTFDHVSGLAGHYCSQLRTRISALTARTSSWGVSPQGPRNK